MRGAIAAASIAVGLAGALVGCGLKGSLYLPSQKKAKVPATATNPAPDAPNSPNSPNTTSSTNPPDAAPAAGAQAPPP
ncbi:MAG TPA: lipoprotein [Steroidobacteraceae bacterium]|nr:lipoprotein [Steroidobacteraceae bacterium]